MVEGGSGEGFGGIGLGGDGYGFASAGVEFLDVVPLVGGVSQELGYQVDGVLIRPESGG